MTSTTATTEATRMNLPTFCADCGTPLAVAGATSIAAAIAHARVTSCTGAVVRR